MSGQRLSRLGWACWFGLVLLFWVPPLGATPHRWTPTYGSPFGINIHTLLWDGDPKAVASVVDLGVGWIRADFNWSFIEPQKGKFNWKVTDGIVNVAIKNKLNIFATLAYGPSWANPPGTPAGKHPPAQNPADWTRFVTAVVQRYKGKISHWGLWNEPNLTHFLYFPDSTSRSQRIKVYVQQILIPGARAVKAADPDAVVLSPELASLGGFAQAGGSCQKPLLVKPKKHSWNCWLEDVLQQAGKYLDIITHHTYKDDFLTFLDGSPPVWEPPSVLSILKAKGQANKPFWLTEIGWHTDKISESQQASNYTKLLKGMLARSWWNKIFPYELKDDPNIKDKWGIVRANWSRKPAWTAYRDFIRQHQPVPRAGSNRTVQVGVPVALDGSASSDPDGKIVRYSWDFDDRNGVKEDAKGARVKHTFSRAGTYQVTLTVTDNHGIAIGTQVQITARGTAPPQAYKVVHAPAQVRLDGHLQEWAQAHKITLKGQDYVREKGAWGGAADLMVEAFWMWSAKGLYLAARVTDNSHNNTQSAGKLWLGDSLQLGIDADNDQAGPDYDKDGDYEFGLALSQGKPLWERTAAPSGAPPASLQVAVRRSGTTTFYEALLPAAALKPLSFQAGEQFGLTFLVNDNDGSGRKGWLEWTPGLGKAPKDPSRFSSMLLLAPNPTETPTETPPAEPPTEAVQPPEKTTPEEQTTPPDEQTTPPPDAAPEPTPPPDQTHPPDTTTPDAAPEPSPGDSPTGHDPLPDSPTSHDDSSNTDSTGGEETPPGCSCQQNNAPTLPLVSLLLFLLLLPARPKSRKK